MNGDDVDVGYDPHRLDPTRPLVCPNELALEHRWAAAPTVMSLYRHLTRAGDDTGTPVLALWWRCDTCGLVIPATAAR